MGEARDDVVIGEITLPGVRRSVGCARSFVREVVLGHDRLDDPVLDEPVPDEPVLGEPVLDDMITVASETVANAITHTASGLEGGEVTVVLSAAYVERVRVEAARRALAEGDEPVEALARRLGFGTGETLRRAFHRHVGVAPSDYRDRFRGVGEYA